MRANATRSLRLVGVMPEESVVLRASATVKDRGAEGPRGRGAEGPKGRRAEGPKGRRAEGPRGRRAEGPKGRAAEGPRGRGAEVTGFPCRATELPFRACSQQTVPCPHRQCDPSSNRRSEGPWHPA